MKKPTVKPRASLETVSIRPDASPSPTDEATGLIGPPIDPATVQASPPPSGMKTSDGSHFEGISVGADPGAEPEPEIVVEPSQALDAGQLVDGKFLSVEAFTAGIRRSMRAVGKVTVFKSLTVGPDDEEFPEAMAALYDSIRDTPMLHFLIQPGSLWVQRAMAIGSWAVPVGMGCYADLQMVRQARKAPAPANDDATPGASPAQSATAGPERFEGFD